MARAWMRRLSPEKPSWVFRNPPYRRLTQVLFFGLTLWSGLQFAVFVHQLKDGRVPTVLRPQSIEAFLPISALLSLKYWIITGVISHIHPAALILFLTFLAMTLLFKRAFCSWVCPIGLALEALAFAKGEVLSRKVRLPKTLDVLFRAPKYALLGFFVWVVCLKMDAPQIRAFLDSPYHRIADIKMLEFFQEPSRATLWVLGALILLGFFIPYSFCRYLCPYGALLGLISLLSPFKITRSESLCTGCKRCTKACPVGMAIHRKKTVRSAECHACLECVRACPQKGALLFQAISRRLALSLKALALLVVLLVVLGVLGARLFGVWHTSIPLAEYRQHIQRLNEPDYAHPGPTAVKVPRVPISIHEDLFMMT